MASLCPSRPSSGGKPGESSERWVRRIQLQQGGGELGGGGRPAAAQWWGGSSDHSRNAKMRNKLVILHSAESNLCVLGTGEGFEAV